MSRLPWVAFTLIIGFSVVGYSDIGIPVDEHPVDFICHPLTIMNLKETDNRPANARYIPLFIEAQKRLDDKWGDYNKNGREYDPEDSVEYYCGIYYDCGSKFTLDDGSIEFAECE